MNTFKDFLSEGRDAPLYHGTDIASAVGIIKKDIFKASLGLPGVSLTRDFKYADHFAFSEHNNTTNIVVFEFDQRKLSQRYKIFPYNYWWSVSKYANKTRFQRGVNTGKINNEYEEVVAGDIKNADRYIARIHVSPDALKYLKQIDYYSPIVNHKKLFINKKISWIPMKINPNG